MSEKTVISCDAIGCLREHEHEGDDFILNDIKGWLYDPREETHYCPSCTTGIVKSGELPPAYIIGNFDRAD